MRQKGDGVAIRRRLIFVFVLRAKFTSSGVVSPLRTYSPWTATYENTKDDKLIRSSEPSLHIRTSRARVSNVAVGIPRLQHRLIEPRQRARISCTVRTFFPKSKHSYASRQLLKRGFSSLTVCSWIGTHRNDENSPLSIRMHSRPRHWRLRRTIEFTSVYDGSHENLPRYEFREPLTVVVQSRK